MRAGGHKDMATTLGYIRTAEQCAAGFGDVFPALPGSLLGQQPAGRDGSTQCGESPGESPASEPEERQVIAMAQEKVAIPAGIEPALPA